MYKIEIVLYLLWTKVSNGFKKGLTIYQKDNPLDIGGSKLLTIESNGKEYLPLQSIYKKYSEFFFEIEGYFISDDGLYWNENLKHGEDYSKIITCFSKEKSEPLFINVVREEREIPFGPMKLIKMFVYNLMLRPTIYLRNALPLKLKISMGVSISSKKEVNELEINAFKNQIYFKELSDFGEKEIAPGDLIQITSLAFVGMHKHEKSFLIIKLCNYLEKEWTCITQIENRKYTAFWNFCPTGGLKHDDIDLPAV